MFEEFIGKVLVLNLTSGQTIVAKVVSCEDKFMRVEQPFELRQNPHNDREIVMMPTNQFALNPWVMFQVDSISNFYVPSVKLVERYEQSYSDYKVMLQEDVVAEESRKRQPYPLKSLSLH